MDAVWGIVGLGMIVQALPVTTQGDPAVAPAPTEPAAPPPARRPPHDRGIVAGGVDRLVSALTALRDTIKDLRYPLSLPAADDATKQARLIIGQLDDYLLPRLGRLDAPLLV